MAGSCAKYNYSCTPGSMFLATTSDNAADGAVPHFTFHLNALGVTAPQRCITSIKLQLTQRDAGVGCTPADYRATLVGLRVTGRPAH